MTRSYLVCAVLVVAGSAGWAGCKSSDRSAAKAEPAAKAADTPPGTNPFARSVDAVLEGRALYLKYGCSGCHGLGGGGGMGKPISDDQWQFASDDQTLFKLIRGDVPNQTMPNAIGKAMTDDEIWKTLVYVRSLYQGDPSTITWIAPPPVPPDRLAAATQQSGDPITAGKQIFVQICVPCHGPEGKGDGPASAALEPKPRNLTDPTVMAPLDDRYLFELISRGGIAVGKSPLMPAQPSLAREDIGHVIAYVKTLSGQ